MNIRLQITHNFPKSNNSAIEYFPPTGFFDGPLLSGNGEWKACKNWDVKKPGDSNAMRESTLALALVIPGLPSCYVTIIGHFGRTASRERGKWLHFKKERLQQNSEWFSLFSTRMFSQREVILATTKFSQNPINQSVTIK